MDHFSSLFSLFAYLDPGTGSMLVQSLIGIIAGVGLFGRKALHSIRAKGKRSGPTPEQDQPLD